MADTGTGSTNKKIRVGVIFGGRSAEHEVSLVSAKAVLNAIDPEKYDVDLIGLTREGRWLSLGDAKLAAGNRPDPLALMEKYANPKNAPELPGPSASKTGLAEVNSLGGAANVRFSAPVDVIFPVLHGPYGEDGTMQGFLEMANVPYVGCGVLASAIGMDKVTAREVFKQHGLPVLEYFAFKRRDWEKDAETQAALLDRIEAEISYPNFVKPVNMGSSVGVSKARDRHELAAAIEMACHYDRKIMVEKALNPRELEVAVLGNDDPMASVVGEILISRKSDFYSYTAKYQDNEVGFTIPADIPPELSDRLRGMAVQAFLALDGAGMTRVDFFQDRASGEVYLNEVNTIPGFTPVSMYPMMWEKTGISYRELVDRLIELALERHADKNRNELRVQ